MTVNGTNLSMTRGDSESITITCTEAPFASGDTITMTVRPEIEGNIVMQKVVTEFDSGVAVIEILPADTSSLEMDTDYVYDIQLIRADGTVTTIIKPSDFSIGEEVTY